jgi:hypothetical protein
MGLIGMWKGKRRGEIRKGNRRMNIIKHDQSMLYAYTEVT